MHNKPIKIIALTLAALVLIACACPLTNLISNVASTSAEDIAELIPENLNEQLPEVGELLQDLPGNLPIETESLSELLPGVEGLLDQGVPENIPMVRDYTKLFTMAGTITYETPLSFEEAVTFYEVEMAQLGWKMNADASNIIKSEQFALMNFTNETQVAIIGVTGEDTYTQVTIVVANK